MSEQLEVQLLALPLLLVSFRWWENYANTNEAIGEFNVKEIPEETLISLVDRVCLYRVPFAFHSLHNTHDTLYQIPLPYLFVFGTPQGRCLRSDGLPAARPELFRLLYAFPEGLAHTSHNPNGTWRYTGETH